MTESPFDQFSESYERHIDTPALRAIGGATSRSFIQLKCKELLNALRAHGFDPAHVVALDAGCGTGIAEEFLSPFLNKIIGIDASEKMIQQAQQKRIARCEFKRANALQIPLPEAFVQVVFYMCLYHHTKPMEQIQFLEEARRVLKPGGLLAIFEHNPWNPFTVYIVRRCPVDANASLIPAGRLRTYVRRAGFQNLKTRFLVFFPRRLKRILSLERWLCWCPIGGQYLITATK
jgi:SAM-dependent methyltransferase